MTSSTSINLQVDECHFTMLISTLFNEFFFFTLLLSDHWEDFRFNDDSYFIDVNSNLFAHILHYLQHEVLSVIYKKSHRFDYAFYLTLQRKTLYFEIELLYKWVKEKSYLQVVMIQYSVKKIKEQDIYMNSYDTTVNRNIKWSYYSS